MLIDGRLVHPDMILRADVCIIGTGMGAISAANLLIEARHDVLFIETGPMTMSRRDRSSIRVENVGRPFGISTSRGLEVGGGTGFWHGVCAPLDDEDFLERSWIPHSGWPIKRDELVPWYAVASSFLCGSGQGTDEIADPVSTMMRSVDGFDAKTYRYRASPFRGKETLRDWCRRGLARCVYNSTALQLLQKHGRSHTLLVGSGKHSFSVIANRFVIAAGALETPRLLLNSLRQSTEIHPPSSWWLGRNLIDHPTGYLSQVTLRQRFAGQAIRKRKALHEVQDFPGFMLKGDLQRMHEVPNHAVFIRRGINKRPVPNKAIMSFLGIRGARDLALSHLTSLIHHPYIVWRIAHQKLPLPILSRYADLFFMTEQLPNPNSRVNLSDHERDEFGFPIARVDWQLSEQDISMFNRYHELLMSSLLEQSGVRDLRADPITRWEDTFTSAAHHLGTARMAATVMEGVVDRNLKVFGFDNVWVSDGSVFPTAGSVNPSLTICALGHRLGAHLKGMRA
jgi:choline dehydrogenase-like flavoprotein